MSGVATAPSPATPPTPQEWIAPAHWQRVEIISDLHLQASHPRGFEALRDYLDHSRADAIVILGDLFEAWVGDDMALQPGFEADCAELLRQATAQRPLFFMHGNRDFLVGEDFSARFGVGLLPDPVVLVLRKHRWLLTHGDLLCLDDTEYLRFRAGMRDPAWQRQFLARPLDERLAYARHLRTESAQRHADPAIVWADVDEPAAREWLAVADARTLIHGHTHRPAVHDLGDGLERIVLSDWDLDADPPRASVLALVGDRAERIDLCA